MRSLAASADLDIADSARLFAMAHLAAADGSIGCWNDKHYWNFWRPITAIREAADRRQSGDRGRPGLAAALRPDDSRLRRRRLSRPASPTTRPGTPASAARSLHALKAFFGTDKIAFTAVSNKCSPRPARRGASTASRTR